MSKFEAGYFYHIYNRGNNSGVIFNEDQDINHFLDLYSFYLSKVAETLAYCIIPNHFHFCIQIKEDIGQKFFDSRKKNSKVIEKWRLYDSDDLPPEYKVTVDPLSMIKSFFISYALWYNNKYDRTGSLFEKNFEIKDVDSDEYLVDLITYINANPIKHKLVKKLEEYKWSSYIEVINNFSEIVDVNRVIGLFEDIENFKFVHKNKKFE